MTKVSLLPPPASRQPVKKLLRAGCLIAVGLFSGVAVADQQADWEQRLAHAAELQKEGAEGRVAAEKQLEEQTAACFRKFLVNQCHNKAHSDFVATNNAARRIQNEGKAIERQVKKEQLSAHDLQAAAEMPEREAELRAREAETTAVRAAAAAEEEATRAAKARKAEEGAKRKAEDAERLRKKQADHDARVAEQAEKSRAKAAESAPTKP